jgi:hypothetical protein
MQKKRIDDGSMSRAARRRELAHVRKNEKTETEKLAALRSEALRRCTMSKRSVDESMRRAALRRREDDKVLEFLRYHKRAEAEKLAEFRRHVAEDFRPEPTLCCPVLSPKGVAAFGALVQDIRVVSPSRRGLLVATVVKRLIERCFDTVESDARNW